jgi:MinD-like ATPase involved in chromosome partitioning or flagellar assembly
MAMFGEIMTFYSYKGGVGRSMTLANVACLLARRFSQKVLMIDWDLEAPGLHWFFQKRSAEQAQPDLEFQHKIQAQPGLIDLFQDLEQILQEVSDEDAVGVMERLDLERYIMSANVPELPNLWLLKAGRFDEEYSRRVNGFDWVGLYERSPHIFQHFAQRFRQEYQYTLIDSRTGITDTSGICTALMPQKLVTVFTPNQQSLTGVLETARKATTYRKQSDDLNPLVVYPVPSRVETSETTLRSQWRKGTPENPGYQPRFEQLLQQIYDLPVCNLEDYFDNVQIQHFPRYAYGEEIAVLVEREVDRLSLTSSYLKLTEQLLSPVLPWEYVNLETRVFDPQVKRSPFDVFLSYRHQDRESVRAIAQSLEERGIRPWLDVEEILPGQIFTNILEQGIAQSGAIAIFIGENGIGDWQTRELANVVEPLISRGKPIIPVLLPTAQDVSHLPLFLKDFVWVDFRRSNPDPIDQLIWGITGKKPN